MSIYKQPYLQKYTGKASRFKCPGCGDPVSLALYLDGNTGNVINSSVGRCNHESGCGYHYTPKQYFTDYPEQKDKTDRCPVVYNHVKPVTTPDFINSRYVGRQASYKSNFVHFLCGLFDIDTLESPTIERLMQDYAIGATADGSVIFWQIDITGKVRTGKIMQYNPETGKRVKTGGGINWVHSVMKRRKELPDTFNLVQCLFGEHLLTMYPGKTVALVESEKSALIASGLYPQYVWVATGGKSQLSKEKLKVLSGRSVIMFPDIDGVELWKEKAKAVEELGCNVVVSDLLERNCTPEEIENKIDVADWIIRELTEKNQAYRLQYEEKFEAFEWLKNKNPALSDFVEQLDLVVI